VPTQNTEVCNADVRIIDRLIALGGEYARAYYLGIPGARPPAERAILRSAWRSSAA